MRPRRRQRRPPHALVRRMAFDLPNLGLAVRAVRRGRDGAGARFGGGGEAVGRRRSDHG